jgi:TolA-binding protein
MVKAKFFTAQLVTTTFSATMVAVLLFLGLAGLCAVPAIGGPSASAAQADATQESWRTEFDNVCAKTEDAMTFSQEELMDLIRRCDSLQPRIEKLDESRKKVYLERLRKCRGLYAYVLDAKRKEKK